MKSLSTLTVLLLSIMLFGSCDDSVTGTRNFEPGREFNLDYGESAVHKSEHLTLQFYEVMEDSRCPSDVTCVWAGNAKIGIEIIVRNNSRRLELNTHPDMERAGIFQGYVVELKELNPYPERHDEPIPKESYVARLLVEAVD